MNAALIIFGAIVGYILIAYFAYHVLLAYANTRTSNVFERPDEFECGAFAAVWPAIPVMLLVFFVVGLLIEVVHYLVGRHVRRLAVFLGTKWAARDNNASV